MSKTKQHVVVSSRKIAEWLDGQPGTWWNVDGDPVLTSEVDFPCPNEELAKGFRKHDSDIKVFTKKRNRPRAGEDLNSLELDDLVDKENPRGEKNLLAAWMGSDIEWLLSEDKDMAEEARRTIMESMDAKAAN